MGHLVGQLELLHRGRRIPSADHGDRVFQSGQCLRDLSGSRCERFHLEDAHRPVPHHGLGALEPGRVVLGRLRTDVEAQPSVRYGLLHHFHVGGFVKPVRNDVVCREQQLHLLGRGLLEKLAGQRDVLLVHLGRTDADALRRQKGIRHSPADDHGVHFAQQTLNHLDLVGHLCAAQDRHERFLRRVEHPAQVFDLLLHEETGGGRQVLGHAAHGDVLVLHGAEGVIHVEVAQSGQLAREPVGDLLVLLLFLRMEPQVLQQHDVPRLHLSHCALHLRSDAVLHHRNLLAEQLLQANRHRSKRILRIRLSLRPAQVRHQDQPPPAIEHVPDALQGGLDPRIVGHLARLLVQRDVEIHAHEDAFAGDVDGLYAQFGHGPASPENKNSSAA